MIKLGIVSQSKKPVITSLLGQLRIDGIEVVDLIEDIENHPEVEIAIFNDLDITKVEGDKDLFLDSLRDVLAHTSQLLIANLNDEWVAEITKEVMKKSPITVLDYNRNHFGDARNEEKAVYLVGLACGLSVEEIKERLGDE
jgi:hypothetical protein